MSANATYFFATRPGVSTTMCWSSRPLGVVAILFMSALLPAVFAYVALAFCVPSNAWRVAHKAAIEKAYAADVAPRPEDDDSVGLGTGLTARLRPASSSTSTMSWSWSVIPSVSFALNGPLARAWFALNWFFAFVFSLVCYDNPVVWGLVSLCGNALFQVSLTSWRYAPHYAVTCILALVAGPVVFAEQVLFLQYSAGGANAWAALLAVMAVCGVLFLAFPFVTRGSLRANSSVRRWCLRAQSARERFVNILETSFAGLEIGSIVTIALSLLLLTVP